MFLGKTQKAVVKMVKMKEAPARREKESFRADPRHSLTKTRNSRTVVYAWFVTRVTLYNIG